MVIPLVDVSWQHSQVRTEVAQGIDQLLTDPHCDGSEFIKTLEVNFARRLGSGVFAISVQSGTAAEFLILKAIGLGPDDEVITVPNSALATTAAISHTGAKPVFVDIDPCSYTIDPTRIEAAITSRTRAIVPVHMYGLPAEMDAVRAIAQKHGLKVIEDAALALGAEYRGSMAGTLGDAAFFSLASRKILGGLGNGGMVATRDPQLAYQIRLLKGYGMDPELGERSICMRHISAGRDYLAEGFNMRLDGVQAIVIGAKFAYLDEWRALRQRVADRYAVRLAGVKGVELPRVPSHMRHAWRNFVIKIPQRDHVRARLLEKGIITGVLYTPVHLQTVYQHLGLGVGSFLAAESVAKSLLCLPMYPGLADEQVDQIVAVLVDSLREMNQG